MDVIPSRNNSYDLLCRLCLSAEDNLISVFEENYSFLPQRIAACVNVEIYTSDQMPTTICKSCLTRVDNWFEFKKCCDDSQSKLRQWSNINSIISRKTMIPQPAQVKEEFQLVTDIQIVENSICAIKEEPVDDENLLPPEIEQNSFVHQLDVENTESLLVPNYECPASVHGGINSSFSKSCRECLKEFSSVTNRIRHEQSVHFISIRETSDNNFSFEGFENIEPSVVNNDVTIEQFAASLQLVQTNDLVPKPIYEKQFIEFHKLMTQMLTRLECFLCGVKYDGRKAMLNHLSKVFKLDKYSCFYCCVSFQNCSQYKQHFRPMYCKQRARLIQNNDCKAYQHYQCSLCDRLFGHKMLLNSHLVNSHLKDQDVSFCKRCSKSFQDRNTYKQHLQESCFYTVFCSICKSCFSEENFTDHCKIHDGDTKFCIEDYIDKKYDCRKKLTKAMNMYSCSTCGEQFPNLDLWCEHQQVHSNKNVNRCTECNRVFGTEFELEQHKSTHLNNNIKLKLLRCSDTNSYKAVSEFSSESSEKVQEQRFICKKCKKVFSSEQKLRNHKRTHTHIDTSYKVKRAIVCQICSARFYKLHSYKLHKCAPNKIKKEFEETVSTQTVNKTYQCEICKEIFSHPAELNAHSRIHKYTKLSSLRKRNLNAKKESLKAKQESLNPKRFICKGCSKAFTTSKGLALHIRCCTPNMLIKTELETYNCNFCHMEFDSRAALNLHIKVHFSGTNIEYKCTFCPKVCTRMYQLTVHVQTKHTEFNKNTLPVTIKKEKPTHRCHVCKKPFKSDGLLKKHLKTHAKKSVSKKYKCKGCHKYLESALQLKYHMNTNCLHCLICNRDFTSASGYTNHKRQVHNALKEYNNCNECDEKFDNKSEYVRHLKIHKKYFKCKLCPKVFALEKTYFIHCSKHADKNENPEDSKSIIKREVKPDVKQEPFTTV